MSKSLAIVDCQQLFLSAREEFGPLARLDYVQLRKSFNKEPEDTVDAIIYILSSPYHDDRNFLRFLKKNGYIIMRRFAQLDNKAPGHEVKFKNKPWSDSMCWEAIKMLPNYDSIQIVSGNGAFCSVVAAAHDQGKKVTVVSFRNSLQEALKNSADEVIILNKEHIFDSASIKKQQIQN